MFSHPLNSTLQFLSHPSPILSPVCYLPFLLSQSLNLSSSALEQKKKKSELVNSAAECQGARRVGRGSVTRRAHSPSACYPACCPPLPRVPPSLGLQSSVPGLPAQCQPPVYLGGGGFQAPIPAPSHSQPPPGTVAQASKSLLIWTLFLLPLSPQLFITALERGSRAPRLASPITEKGKTDIWGPDDCSPLPAVTSRPPPTPYTWLETFRFLLKLCS